MLMESQYWPPDKMLAWQRTHLADLLHHARANVAFYRQRLDCVFRSDGAIAWERWHELPILTRADLRDQRPAMQSSFIPPGHGRTGIAKTSGSTGVPITYSISGNAFAVAKQFWHRFYHLHGIGADIVQAEHKVYLPGGKRMSVDHIEHRNAQTGKTVHFINRNLENERKLALLANTKTSCLVDATNHIEVLARANLRRAQPVALRWVVGLGMGITNAQRQLFRQSFGALALSPYSSTEGNLMAFQCAKVIQNFHINSELLFHEILDHDNNPCAPGQVGRFIITPLFNAAQPLIRYDTGDLVRAGTECACGSGLPVLAEIAGRSDEIFRFPGQERALARFGDELVQTALAAEACQYAQTEPLGIQVRYVAGVDASDEACERVRQHLLDVLKVDISIGFVRVARIPVNAGGKQQRVVCELPAGLAS